MMASDSRGFDLNDGSHTNSVVISLVAPEVGIVRTKNKETKKECSRNHQHTNGNGSICWSLRSCVTDETQLKAQSPRYGYKEERKMEVKSHSFVVRVIRK